MDVQKTFFYKVHTSALLLVMLSVSGITAFCVHPFVSFLSYVLGTLSFLCYDKRKEWCALFRFTAPIGIFLILFNLIFNRNGATVFFYLGDACVTVESILYAVCAAFSFSAITLWFSFFCYFLDADRIFLWCSGISKNFAILFSLSMSLVPKTLKKYEEIKMTGKESENQKAKLRNWMLHMSALFSWVWEDSFETAISMKARGALLKKKRKTGKCTWRMLDFLLFFFSLGMLFLPFMASALKQTIYPVFSMNMYWNVKAILPYSLVTILYLIPLFYKLWEAIQWKSIK